MIQLSTFLRGASFAQQAIKGSSFISPRLHSLTTNIKNITEVARSQREIY
jgi:hypothetical protein